MISTKIKNYNKTLGKTISEQNTEHEYCRTCNTVYDTNTTTEQLQHTDGSQQL